MILLDGDQTNINFEFGVAMKRELGEGLLQSCSESMTSSS
jgi:hypothetical protein